MDKSHFERLPGELRNDIYSLVLKEEQPIPLTADYKPEGLLSVCRSIRSEARGFFYDNNSFTFDRKYQCNKLAADDDESSRIHTDISLLGKFVQNTGDKAIKPNLTVTIIYPLCQHSSLSWRHDDCPKNLLQIVSALRIVAKENQSTNMTVSLLADDPWDVCKNWPMAPIVLDFQRINLGKAERRKIFSELHTGISVPRRRLMSLMTPPLHMALWLDRVADAVRDSRDSWAVARDIRDPWAVARKESD